MNKYWIFLFGIFLSCNNENYAPQKDWGPSFKERRQKEYLNLFVGEYKPISQNVNLYTDIEELKSKDQDPQNFNLENWDVTYKIDSLSYIYKNKIKVGEIKAVHNGLFVHYYSDTTIDRIYHLIPPGLNLLVAKPINDKYTLKNRYGFARDSVATIIMTRLKKIR